MAKLAVITTGGTIASVLKKGYFSVQETNSPVAAMIQHAADTLGFSIDILSPVNKNSESMTPENWLDVLLAIREACDSQVDGVVVLHGTDTMQYTLAAAGCFNWPKRVCFTGAMISPEIKGSDAHINLLAAMSFAVDHSYERGVYLAFCRHADRRSASVFRAHEVKPLSFDESGFQSVYDEYVASYSEQSGLLANHMAMQEHFPSLARTVLPNRTDFGASQQQVAYIKLYPGLDLSTLKKVSEGRLVVVIELYHSGTGPASADYDDLLSLLEGSNGTTLFVLSSFPSKMLQHPYTSTKALIQAGAYVCRDLQPHCVYVLCLLMLALGKSVKDIKKHISSYQL